MSKKVVVAFSGGLDTSYCVKYLQKGGFEVYTAAIDTGGFDEAEQARIERAAADLGSASHRTIDARKEVFDRFGTYIVKGNVLRGNAYPLCVSAERVVQAEKVVAFAQEVGATAICHGSTGAGNDQVRFDVAFRTLMPGVEIITPIRSFELSREEEVAFLSEHGVELPGDRKTYSINQGIIGTTIGGGETHDSWSYPPDEAFPFTTSPQNAPNEALELTLEFKNGLPCGLNGSPKDGYEILLALNEQVGSHGFGRGMHLGDTILGIKGRLAFEAPGMLTLIAAHQELEKLVLTKDQQITKNDIGQRYGAKLHEAEWFDPAVRDYEALIDSSQRNVTGEVKLQVWKGNLTVLGVRSPYSLMSGKAMYGEGSSLWNNTDATGFCQIYGTQAALAFNVTKELE